MKTNAPPPLTLSQINNPQPPLYRGGSRTPAPKVAAGLLASLVLFLLGGLSTASAQSLEILYNEYDGVFTGHGVRGPDGSSYGATNTGGYSNQGSVLKISPEGTLTLLHSFSGEGGQRPTGGLIRGSDGKLYGVTSNGGTENLGVIYCITTEGAYTELHNFTLATGGRPQGALVEGEPGLYYGITLTGGAEGQGGIFKIDSNGTYTLLHSLSENSLGGVGLTRGPGGDFYGIAGSSFFQCTSSGVFTHLATLPSLGNISGRLLLASDGNFYGAAPSAGANGLGHVFRITPDGVYTNLHDFSTGQGSNGNCNLVQAPGGEIYGTCTSGGNLSLLGLANSLGTVYKISLAGEFSLVHAFLDAEGDGPGALQVGEDGDLYGFTNAGGQYNAGTEFSIDSSDQLTVIRSFRASVGRSLSGGMQHPDGSYYAITVGGDENVGAVVKYGPTGQPILLHSFTRSPTVPASTLRGWGVLEVGEEGDLYGATRGDGGAIFKISRSGQYTVLHEFTALEGGDSRYGLTYAGGAGFGAPAFYGTSYSGGEYNDGTVFRITADGTLTVLHAFNSTDGRNPNARLIRGNDGCLYGVTQRGGENNAGVIFKIDTFSQQFTLLHSLNAPVAFAPVGLALGPDGLIYGTANYGGAHGKGTVFKFNPAGGPVSILHSFTENPVASAPVVGGDGKLYGSLTGLAGAHGLGAIYELSLQGDFRVIHHFDGTEAGDPSGEPFVDNDGKLVGFSQNATLWRLDILPEFTFSAEHYTWQEGDAEEVTVTVTRSGDLDAASVTLATSDGSASTVPPFEGAVAGLDYEALITQVDFNVGELSKEVVIQLPPRADAPPNRRFQVTLSNPTNGAELGTLTSAEVRLLSQDGTNPKLTVAFPSATTTTVRQTAPVQLRGTAGDARGVERVEVEYQGVTSLATLGAATNPNAVPWTFELTPASDGPVNLIVRSYDLSGNVTTVTRTFDFIRRYPVEVTRNVPGGLASPDLAGNVRLASTSGAFTALSPTKGAATQTAEVVPASPVTLTPRALTGYVFSHWEGLPAGAQLTGAVASFVMPAENVTGITAVFITSPYLGLGAQPLFYGVLSPTGATGSSHATHGSVTAVRIRSSGLFSGRIVLDGQSYAFTGLAQGDGTVWFKRADKQFHASLILPNGAVMTGRFESGQLMVDITNGSDTLSSTASAVAYSKTQPVPANLLNRARKAGGPIDMGFYTAVLPAKAQTPAKPLTEYPQGTGYANLRLDNKGRFTVAGVLADGTRWTASSMLVGDGTVAPLYVRLATPGTTTRQMGGSLLGTLNFDTEASDSDATATDLLWFRPAVTEQSGATAVARATQIYTAGWPAGIGVDLIGAKYDHAADAQTNLGLAGPAQLDFSEGKLAETVTVSNFSVSGNAVIKTLLKDKSFTLSFLQPTGLFRGSFTPDWSASRKPAFTGMQLTKGANKGGWGHFLSNQTGDTDPESGNVTLGSQE